MGVNRIIYGDKTLIDLTKDTVTAETLEKGVTAHGANGEQVVGTMSVKEEIEQLQQNVSMLGNALGAHIENADNPHRVTASQAAAAPVQHTHEISDIIWGNSNDPGAHNAIYRGKKLEAPDEQLKTKIANGDFQDLYIGDYWTGLPSDHPDIVPVDTVWYIAAFDYFPLYGQYGIGHHIVVVPDRTFFYDVPLDNKNPYGQTEIDLGLQYSFQEIFEVSFNGILAEKHYVLLPADLDANGVPLLYISTERKGNEFLNERMVFGGKVTHPIGEGAGYERDNTAGQLPLFRFRPDLIWGTPGGEALSYWLRDQGVGNYTAIDDGEVYGDIGQHAVRPYCILV